MDEFSGFEEGESHFCRESHKGKRFRSQIFSYLAVPLNINYYILASPVPIPSDKPTPTNLMQMLCCAIMQTLVLANALLKLYKTLNGDKVTDKPEKLFEIAQEMAFVFCIAFWIHASWRKRGIRYLLETSFRYIPSIGDTIESVRPKRCVIWVACFGYPVFVGLMRVSADLGLLTAESAWENFKNKTSDWRHDICLDEQAKAVTDPQMTFAIVVITLLYMFLEWYRWVFDAATLTFWFAAAYSIDVVAEELTCAMDKNSFLTLNEIRQSLHEVKLLVKCVNEVCGYFTLVNFLSTLSYFGLRALEILDNNGWATRIETTADGIFFLALFIYAASGNHKLAALEGHIFCHLEHLKAQGSTDAELTLFLMELESTAKGLGLQGGNFFTISYGFLGTFAGTFATFLFIILQFKSSN